MNYNGAKKIINNKNLFPINQFLFIRIMFRL
jgi:hypothetical protein